MLIVIVIKVEEIVKIVNHPNIRVIAPGEETIQIGVIKESITVIVDYTNLGQE